MLDRQFRYLISTGLAFHQHTLFAYLDLHRTGAAMGISRLDFRSLLAGQGDFGLGLITVRPAQVIEQLGLILIGQGIIVALFANASLA